jgi:hypothetical protein
MNRKSTCWLVLILGCAVPALPIMAQSSACTTTLSADAQAVSNDLAAIAAQAGALGFSQAVQTLAKDLEAILPTLSVPDQQLVEKFLNDLAAATASSGPGGASITPSEKIVLTNDINKILVSSGLTSSQINTLSNDILAVMSSLSGISTAQLQVDLQKMVADAKACRLR